MQRFRLAHARGENAADVTAACLAQLGTVPASASLGFVYATDALAPALGDVLARLQRATPHVSWIGTVGVGVVATAQEYYEQPALAVMVGEFPPDSFRTMPSQHAAVDEYVDGIADWLAQNPSYFGIVHADPTNHTTPAILEQLATRVPGAFLVGGLTSAHRHHVQIADTLAVGGVSGVLFAPEVAVVVSHTQGCTPIGPVHRITGCERNILRELDGRPALEVFKEDIGEVMARDLARVGGYIFAAFPIVGSDTGDYVVRNLLGIDRERQWLAIGDYLAPGRQLMFCRRDGNSARADLERMLVDLKRRQGANPKGAVYYSCLGRGRHQFGGDSAELKLIADALGDLPLVGFFANGEIFHNRLYAYTGVLSIFC